MKTLAELNFTVEASDLVNFLKELLKDSAWVYKEKPNQINIQDNITGQAWAIKVVGKYK